jgi:carboxyl-terminal processing protease
MEVKNPVTYKITEKRNDGTIVGYIRISEFNSLVKPKLEDAIKSLKASGANAFVMDLRQNPGGAFQSAVEIAGLFLDDKIATNVIDSNQVEMVFRTTKGKTLLELSVPLVIWQDGGSASASEVLAGALHDQCRAVVMGSNSFGKGLIQAVYGLKNGSGFVLTVAKYQTPGGTDIQGIGITPDIEAKLPTPLIIGLSTDTSIVDFKGAAAKACPVTASD